MDGNHRIERDANDTGEKQREFQSHDVDHHNGAGGPRSLFYLWNYWDMFYDGRTHRFRNPLFLSTDKSSLRAIDGIAILMKLGCISCLISWTVSLNAAAGPPFTP